MGIDPLYFELSIQAATLASPFIGTFDGTCDAAGTSADSWTWWGAPGITLYAVTIEHLAGAILRASPPITTVLGADITVNATLPPARALPAHRVPAAQPIFVPTFGFTSDAEHPYN